LDAGTFHDASDLYTAFKQELTRNAMNTQVERVVEKTLEAENRSGLNMEGLVQMNTDPDTGAPKTVDLGGGNPF
jgi:hypothetical protein